MLLGGYLLGSNIWCSITIYVMRDPGGVALSRYNFRRKYRSMANTQGFLPGDLQVS